MNDEFVRITGINFTEKVTSYWSSVRATRLLTILRSDEECKHFADVGLGTNILGTLCNIYNSVLFSPPQLEGKWTFGEGGKLRMDSGFF